MNGRFESPTAASVVMADTAPTWIRALLQGAPVEGERVLLRPGQIVPGTRYRILRWRGEGGMGVVYEAEHVDLERRTAVKILQAHCGSRPAVVRAFRDEARAVSRVGSDFIVRIYDFVELTDGRLMIAMEWLDGIDLHREVDGPMDPGRAVAILRQACKGLAAAHEAGVVHRDVKPENVILVRRGGRADAVKLVDFGIASIHDGNEYTSVRGGTPFYLAPEVIRSGHVTPAVDVYGLGVMAFEMLTGTVPFRRGGPSEVLKAHLDEPPPRLSARHPEVPAALEAVVLRCLEKDPASRPGDMHEVEALLCEAQLACGLRSAWDDLPLPPMEPSRQERLLALQPGTELPSRRRRLVRAAAVASVLGLGTAIGVLTLRPSTMVEDGSSSSWVDERAVEAREAAAKALFVYPPFDEPTHVTAFSVIEVLEARQGPDRDAAQQLAEQLREELCATLVRLGGEYWDAEGGRPFAVAYYEQALLFDPEHELARERSEASDEQLEELASRAGTLAFSAPDLLDAEPLVVLAASSAESRAERLRTLHDRRQQRELALADRIARAGGLSPAAYALSREASSSASHSRRAVDPDLDSKAALHPSHAAEAPERGSSRSLATALASRGKAALAAGKLSRAEDLYEQALGHDRHNITALAGLRDIAFERAEYDRAIDLGERAVRGRPDHASHRLRLGDAYLKVLRYRDALAQYERARALGEPRAGWRIDKLQELIDPD